MNGPFKIVLLGDGCIGKSTFFHKLSKLNDPDYQFSSKYNATDNFDFNRITLNYHNENITIDLWDTAGQERFKTITSSYYKGAHGIIVVYDITDRESFSAIQNWMGEVEKHASDNISRILVGNKCDLES